MKTICLWFSEVIYCFLYSCLVGGQIDTKDLKVNSGFAIFFDEGLDWTTTKVAVEDCVSVYDNLNPVCAKK